MKKENSIDDNKNSKKISKNNKIISSILAVIMCCQSFVGANPNSDNREFVSDKVIDNSPTADGSEEEDEEDEEKKEEKKEDIKIKENNSSSLIRNSLGALLVAAMSGWWFYVTKNKDLKSKNEEIERLKKKLEEKDKELEKICKPDTESDAEVKEEEYLGTKYITFNVGERVKRYGRTFFRNLTDVTDTMSVRFTDNENNKKLVCYESVHIRVTCSKSKQNYNDYKQLSDYSKYIWNIVENGLGGLLSASEELKELGITRASQLKKHLEDLLVSDQKVGPNFRFTNIFIFFSNEERGDLYLFLPQELLSGGFLDIVK
ncbi:MAG: hypothetical protein CfP315_0457 [Candidatus Improbicoccus pseudotrichonymphae]|uniref:Uncharacterized protein n=1 Tax=Candidatus Improbicoccus pseudotrichonymphae TaxID=3033792 RepID=A0AA48IAI5_9FIRM|nr:MAG: hypothetical protein CfP315_0457 [Candidatus Improbicoccus pseudotrichonymphae]